jgi:biotin transport system substrate-specific component
VSSRTGKLTAAALLAALTAAGAYIVIPVGPVPITMQSAATLLAGALLGARWGAASQIVYLLMGLIGIPVFAGGRAGPGVMLSPGFGYLIGFIPAAYITGFGVTRFPLSGYRRALLAMMAGELVLLLSGMVYLYYYMNIFLSNATPWSAVAATGLIPFLPGEAVKMALAASTATLLTRAGYRVN